MKKSWREIAATAAVLVPAFALLGGCQQEQELTTKTPETKQKFLGTGPSEEEKAKMRQLQAQAAQSMGPSAEQAAMMKKRPAKQ